MMTQTPHALERVSIGGVKAQLRDVLLRPDLRIDEIDLDGGMVEIDLSAQRAHEVSVQAGETRFRLMMSEPNLNALLDANAPAEGLVRGLRVAVLQGKIRISGQIAKSVMHLPFKVEAVPLIENGVRVKLDFQAARIGFALPSTFVDLIEQFFNNNRSLPLDLSRLPVPVQLDEIRCDPGRLTALGRTRLSWPFPVEVMTAAPFTPGDPAQAKFSPAEPLPLLPPAEVV